MSAVLATLLHMSTKTKTPNYQCTECGWISLKWVGRCLQCQSWGAVEEALTIDVAPGASTLIKSTVLPIKEIDTHEASMTTTGFEEFDRVLGGGLVSGAVILVAGEPGIGKSTLLLQTAAKYAQQPVAPPATSRIPLAHRKVLYVTGEESAAQVKLRAGRIGALADTLMLTAETDLSAVLSHIDSVSPELLIVDSIQTLSSGSAIKSSGNISQIREVTASLIHSAKSKNMTAILVGHVTKDGSVAGPRLLEHLVDVVCQFDGERHSALRLIRAVKNRFGPTDEVGCFNLGEYGIIDVNDPSQLFISRTKRPVSGTCLTVTLEGKRPLAAEIQALLMQSSSANPRRSTYGLDSNRMNMLLAVLQRRTPHNLAHDDTYVATVGGVKLSEPAVDLAAILAFASAKYDQPLPNQFIALGEVGLAGEVRPIPTMHQRLKEAERLGFTHAIIPATPQGPGALPDTFKIKEVEHISEALELLFSQ